MLIKRDFPFFQHNKDLIYLDNAATTQKPQMVIDAITEYYAKYNAPVHRGVYSLAEHATELYEAARGRVAQFIGAYEDEVIFTRGTTDAINFIADWVSRVCKPGDEIIITELEHHSNIVPWIRLEKSIGITLKYIPIHADGTLDYEAYLKLLTDKTKLVSCTHTSNVLGTHVDLPFIISHAHSHGARVFVDAAQAACRTKLNVHDLKADFLAFSGHKMLGPTGIGVLYLPRHMQSEVEPYQSGGGMVYEVDFHKVTFAKPPQRYEAGTPSIAQAVGLAAAVEYIEQTISFEELNIHEAALTGQLIEGLSNVPGMRILGYDSNKKNLLTNFLNLMSSRKLNKNRHMVSFVSDRMHPHDIAAYLDGKGIAVRAGNHCAQPLHKALGIESSVRVSFYAYTSSQDIEYLISALHKMPLI